jgi:hypothetical protein
MFSIENSSLSQATVRLSIMGALKANTRSAGDRANQDLLSVLPDNISWYTKVHLLKWHFCIATLILFCEFLDFCFHAGAVLTNCKLPQTDTTVVS